MTWQPTWRRLIATTAVGFVLVLALLAWRLQTGHDPALGAAAVTPLTRSSGDAGTATDPGSGSFDDDGGDTDDGSAAGPPSTHAS
jgi:hypothetical protein